MIAANAMPAPANERIREDAPLGNAPLGEQVVFHLPAVGVAECGVVDDDFGDVALPRQDACRTAYVKVIGRVRG